MSFHLPVLNRTPCLLCALIQICPLCLDTLFTGCFDVPSRDLWGIRLSLSLTSISSIRLKEGHFACVLSKRDLVLLELMRSELCNYFSIVIYLKCEVLLFT